MKKILFGAGKARRDALDVFKDEVAFFCDNNKVGEKIEGINVISFDRLKQIADGYDIIISVSREDAKEEIKRLLDVEKIEYELLSNIDQIKYFNELEYWIEQFNNEGKHFQNSWYKKLILSIAGEKNDEFLKNSVVADFGCGPRGSLTWMQSPSAKLGIDVLAAEYIKAFGDDLVKHGMFYITCTEKHIPIPDESVDCLMTINSLDHVRNLKVMCSELLRILKTGGVFIGSFNLYEPATECEPQTLSEEIIGEALLHSINISSYKIGAKSDLKTYENMNEDDFLKEKPDGSFPCILWVRGTKK